MCLRKLRRGTAQISADEIWLKFLHERFERIDLFAQLNVQVLYKPVGIHDVADAL
jgi:hypothetical protein